MVVGLAGRGTDGGPCSLSMFCWMDQSILSRSGASLLQACLPLSWTPSPWLTLSPHTQYQSNFSLRSLALIGIQHCPLPMLGTCSHSHCLHCMVQQILPSSLCSCCSATQDAPSPASSHCVCSF